MMDLKRALPLAVMLDDDGLQELVVPINAVDLAPGVRAVQLATVWTAQQSAN
jgi:hypothetical protein